MRPYGRRYVWRRFIEYDLCVFYSRPGILGIIRSPYRVNSPYHDH